MSDPMRDDAITAAAQVRANANQPGGYWDRLTGGQQDHYRRMVAPLVDAVLAVAGPAYRAEALRDAADDWPEWAKLTDENDRQSLHGHRQVFQSWLRDRADAEEGDR